MDQLHLCRSAPDPSFPVFWHLRSPAQQFSCQPASSIGRDCIHPENHLPGTAFVVHGSFFIHFIRQIRFVVTKPSTNATSCVVIFARRTSARNSWRNEYRRSANSSFVAASAGGEALVLYGGDLWQIIYGCSSDYHDIVSSNLLSINFFLSISQLISFSDIACVVMYRYFQRAIRPADIGTLSQHRKRAITATPNTPGSLL